MNQAAGVDVCHTITQLSEHFESCLGLDISETMVKGARELNADRPACEFEGHPRPVLLRTARRRPNSQPGRLRYHAKMRIAVGPG